MENLGTLIALLSFLAFWVGIVSLFKPIRTFGIKTRKAAAFTILVSFVGFMIGGSMLPTPKKNSSTRDTIATRSENSPKTETAASESSAKPSPAKADMLALWHRVKTASASCDEANAHVADSLELLGKSTSIYTAYELTDSAYNICRESWWDLTQLEVTDSIEGDAADELKKALENCSNAYWLRKRSLDKLKTVLNGDMRPSALQDYKGDAQAAQGGVMACVAGMMGAGLKVGIDVKDFK